MKILVTGGNGFIGSHTVVELLLREYDVVVVDNMCNSKDYVASRINAITKKNFSFYKCDLTVLEELESIFKKEKPDAIIHFAALKSGADSISNPGAYYHNNIDGLFNIVFLMKKYNVNKIVFSSSATVYGNNKTVPILETDPVGDVISPYGMTKFLGELYLERVSRDNSFKCVALRYFNPIGAHPSGLLGEDSPDQIPNNLMLYTLKVANKELPFLRVFGCDYNTADGSGVRDFIHVVDLAKGHIAALDYFKSMKTPFEVFNLGTGKGTSVLSFINCFERINNVDIPFKVVDRRPGDVEKSFACVEKANKKMRWKTELTIEDCVRDAWLFYKKNNISN